MSSELYPAVIRDLAHVRRALALDAAAAFNDFGKVVFADGALPRKMRDGAAAANDHPQPAVATGEPHGHSI